MSLAYKDWKLRYKILFAAVAPFVISVILTLPFLTSKSIENAEDKTKSYNSEVSYGTALSIQTEIDSSLKEIQMLGTLLYESANRNGNLNNEYLDQIILTFFDQNPKYQYVSLEYTVNANPNNKIIISEYSRNNYSYQPESTKDWYTLRKENFKFKVDSTSHNVLYLKTYQEFVLSKNSPLLKLKTVMKNTSIENSMHDLAEYDIYGLRLLDQNMKPLLRIAFNDQFSEQKTWQEYALEALKTGKYISSDTYSDAFNRKQFNLFVPIKFEQLDDTWILYISYPLEQSREQVFQNLKLMLSIVFLCLSLGVAVSLVTARNISEPVTEISDVLKKISAGQYNLSLPEAETSDEIGHMISSAHAFRQNTKDLAEAKIQAEAANSAKTEFLANMSHELRTPMHAMLSYARLGLDKVQEHDVKLNKYFANIISSGERLLKLLNNLLDLSKLEAGKMEFIFKKNNIKLCIEKVINELRTLSEAKNLTIEVKDFLKHDIFDFDEEKITQVFINILSNAIRFSPVGSTITITFNDASLLDNNTYVLPTNKEEQPLNATLISIADQGVGIPVEELSTIFDKFAQSSHTNKGAGGTGLGLSIASNIIEAHGGKIWAENNQPTGAIFNIIIPKNNFLKSHEVKNAKT